MKEGIARERDSPPRAGEASGEAPREFLKYTFYKARPEWRLLPRDARHEQRKELTATLRDLARDMTLLTYSLVGLRADVDFLTWVIADRVQAFPAMAQRIASTELGRYLDTPYAYLAMRRKSTYLGGHRHEGQEGAAVSRPPVGSKFLFVYPFVKKREWYALPFAERQRMMRDHFRVGHKFPGVTIHTGYSFGLDDQEFVLAFEADRPEEFSDLVLELRASEASRYTERETPIFTCIAMEPEAMLAALGE